MLKRAKHLSQLCWLAGTLLLGACENDINKVKEVSAIDVSSPIQRYTGVDIIYSDSAKVKARLFAPLLLQSTGLKPYDEMPKGVNIIFYDKDLNQAGTLVADYAIRHGDEKQIVFQKNVVVTNVKGETFKSDELIWDENTKLMHSTKLVQIKMANGDIMNGTGFQSDQSLQHWTITQSTGIFNVTENEAK